MLLALALAATLQSAAPPASITRTVLATTPTMEAARVEYAAGAVEPPGNHGYDVVLVPIDAGMSSEVDGAPAQWAPGIPILVSRGAPHVLENRSTHAVRFIEVRTIGDAPAGTDRVVEGRDATIVRSTYGKYIRATVWRIEPGGHVEWPKEMDALLVYAAPVPGRVVAATSADFVDPEGEFVRVSRIAASR